LAAVGVAENSERVLVVLCVFGSLCPPSSLIFPNRISSLRGNSRSTKNRACLCSTRSCVRKCCIASWYFASCYHCFSLFSLSLSLSLSLSIQATDREDAMIQADEAQQQQGRQKVNRPIAPKRTVSERRRAKALKQRWIVLTLLCIIPLGSHFVRKELGPLKTAMLGDGVFGLNNTRFAMLLSATALPNLMVPVFGGALLDIRGSRWGTMLFLVLTLIGQILFTLAAHLRWFAGAILAQVVVGIGAGSTVVSQAAISSEYFERTEMGFAIGVLESAHNLSNWLGQALPAQIMASFNASFVTSLCFGVATCALSLVAGILYVRTDIYAEAVSDKIRPLKSDIGSIGELQTQNGICQLATEMTLSVSL